MTRLHLFHNPTVLRVYVSDGGLQLIFCLGLLPSSIPVSLESIHFKSILMDYIGRLTVSFNM